jgi:hypothetical protein
VNPQQVQINAGTFNGVRKGDEWLVASPDQFPSGLLGKDGAPQTLLAKVQSVTPYNAQLVVLAGPAQAVQPEWRAWPTETLATEPNLQPTTKRTTPSVKRSVKMPINAPDTLTMSPY